jgi:hypothetical protein
MFFIAALALISKPPIIFSSGLFSSIPDAFYANVLNDIRENYTVVKAPIACSRRTYDEMCDTLGEDKVPLVAHSSLNLDVLKSHRIKSAFLIDPASAPTLSVSGIEQPAMECRFPVKVVQSRLYASFVPSALQPRFNLAVCEEFEGAGHSDVLDTPWAAAGEFLGIPSEAMMRVAYRDFIKQSIRDWLQTEKICAKRQRNVDSISC